MKKFRKNHVSGRINIQYFFRCRVFSDKVFFFVCKYIFNYQVLYYFYHPCEKWLEKITLFGIINISIFIKCSMCESFMKKKYFCECYIIIFIFIIKRKGLNCFWFILKRNAQKKTNLIKYNFKNMLSINGRPNFSITKYLFYSS